MSVNVGRGGLTESERRTMFISLPIMHTISTVWKEGGVISTHAAIDASDDARGNVMMPGSNYTFA